MLTEELCAKLRPIFGPKIDKLWAAYLTEDRDGRQEIETVLNLMYARATSEGLNNHRILLAPPPQDLAAGEYEVGEVIYNDRPCYPFGLREAELLQHCAIFGRSGSGKTNVAFVLLSGLLNQKKPFLIFDWKRNYRDILTKTDQDILIYTVGRDTAPFQFNPLIPPPGTKPTTHLKKLIEIIATAYYLGEGVMFILQKAIDTVYRKWGVYNGYVSDYPTMKDILTWLENYPAKGREANWMTSTLRAVGTLCFGEMGRVVNVKRQRPIQELLHRNVILELDGLTNSDKTFFIQSLLLWIHHLRLGEPQRETLKHVILIEEAHHILHKKEFGGEGVVEIVLREIRELGEGIILIDQHPSLISLPAMGNTYTTICLNLKHRSDVSTAANCMLLGRDEQDYLGRLPVGQAMVKLQDRWFSTFLINVPWMRLEKGALTDEAVRRVMARSSADSSDGEPLQTSTAVTEPIPMEEERVEELTIQEQEMLLDIVRYSFCGVAGRYERLKLSRRKGTAVKRSLIARGLVSEENIPIGSGMTVLLSLTEAGRSKAGELGAEDSQLKVRASVLHEYWRNVLRKYYEARGYDVETEKGIPQNGAIDLEARRPGEILAIEIETGKSDVLGNIRKALKAGYERVLVVGVDGPTTASIKGKAEKAGLLGNGGVQVRAGHEFAS